MKELRDSRDQHAWDLKVLCQTANEYQADIQARDHDAFETKELIFKLCVEMDEFKEDLKKLQSMPGREAVE